MGKLFFSMFAAGLAGLLGYAIVEPSAPKELLSPGWDVYSMRYAMIIGALVGTTLGAVSGWFQGSRLHVIRGAAGGLVLGVLGGVLGLQIGGKISGMLFGDDLFVRPDAPLLTRIIGRTIVFLPFGALTGMVIGFGSKSWPRAFQGMVGGLLGGAAAGATFDLIGEVVGGSILAARGQVVGEVGTVSRAVTSVIIGAAIGLFLGIVELLSRKAWVRLELGRNEGKEWIIDAPQTFIGRSENAHVPLFGDPNVMPMHACIVKGRGNYRLVDGGSPMGIGVNGIRVPEAYLNHGDIINVGSFALRFLMRNPRAAIPVQDQPRTAAPVAIGLPPVAAPPAAKAFALIATDGPMSGQRIALNDGETVAGREAPGVNLGFDQSASRRHAAFVASPAGVLVRDLGSTNGTLVNGVRVQEMSLRPGDMVKIGSTTFRLE